MKGLSPTLEEQKIVKKYLLWNFTVLKEEDVSLNVVQ